MNFRHICVLISTLAFTASLEASQSVQHTTNVLDHSNANHSTERSKPAATETLATLSSPQRTTTTGPANEQPSAEATTLPGFNMPAAPVTQEPVAEKIGGAQLLSSELKTLHPLRVIDLPPLKTPRLLQDQSKTLSQRLTEHNQPLQVGFARTIPQKKINLANLEWVETSRGTRISVLEIKSEFAAALRANMMLRITGKKLNDLTKVNLRFSGNDGTVFEENGPSYLAERWSPTVSGERLSIEIELPRHISPQQLQLQISQISHLSIAPGADADTFSKFLKISGICERDVVCMANPSSSYLNTAKAVARMLFTSNGNTFVCTGTLLNNQNVPKRNLFWTAAHCISSKREAESLETYWFYQRATCGNGLEKPAKPTTLAGGAKILYTNRSRDTTLLELNAPPPSGAFYAAWSSRPIEMKGTPVIGIHHPAGDVKKYSSGKVYELNTTLNKLHSFYGILWSNGVTESGSSGSGLFTVNSAGEYELRGGLYGGSSSCSAEDAPDFYSRLADVFDKIRPFLIK